MELTDEALEERVKEEILGIVTGEPEIQDVHNLRTRRVGSEVAIELHIRVNPEMTVVNAHAIASRIECNLRERFGRKTFICIHVEPYCR
jgi:divalent metal cation (Fe/Co/Zn/Cd) transporter